MFASFSFASQEAQAASSYKVVGYYPAWGAYGRNYQVEDMDVSKVTHINYAFADICWNGIHGNPDPASPNPQTWSCQDEVGTINVPNGTIVLGDPWIDAQKSHAGDAWDTPIKGNIGALNKLKASHPGLQTIISVGGWSWSNHFSDVAATAATRDAFANSAVNFLRKYGFDGVDLDWEYPVAGGLPGNSYRPDDKHNYTLLLQDIRQKLDAAGATDGKHYLLTIASGASQSYVNNTELSQIAATVDWINIMTYDFNGGWQNISAHNAPLYYDSAAGAAGVPNATTFNDDAAVQAYLGAGVPSNKLILGVPFYGRGWSGCAAAGNGQYQSCTGLPQGTWEAGVFDFSDLQAKYINLNGYTRYWNDTAKVPYLYNPSNGVYISYDDTESMGYKTSYIKTKSLAGAMFWEFSGDRNKTLLNKLTTDLATGGGGDTTAPSVPGNLRSTGKTSSSVSLAWDASTDNVGVTGYTVSYGSTSINVTGTSTTVNGLSANTSYTFTVKARDAAGNVSGASSPLTVTTSSSGGDTTPPSAPTNLAVTGKSSSSVSLSWTASTDNVGVTGYTVSYGSTNLDVTGTSATVSGLSAGTAYTFTVKARDAAGNVSAGASIQATTDSVSSCPPSWSSTAVYTQGMQVTYNGTIYEAQWWTQNERPDSTGQWGVWKTIGPCGGGGDTTAPSVPTNLQSTGKTSSSVSLSWSASTDNVGVMGYTVSYGSTSVNVTGTSTTISGLAANTSYTFTVKARDAAGNVSGASSPLTVTTNSTSGGDTTPPSAPTNLAVSGKTSSSVSLSWTASTDNVGVTGYTVSYGATSVNVTGTSATVSGLAASTTYTFTVKARDAAGNVSSGTSVQATTNASSGPAAWAPNVSYKVGDLVTYGGQIYSCRQAHTSQIGWEPPNVPALWQLQ